MKPILIMGACGYTKKLIEVTQLLNSDVIGVCDPGMRSASANSEFFGLKIIDEREVFDKYSPDQISLVNGLVSIPEQSIRRDLYISYKLKGFDFATLIHPSAIISPTVRLGEGVHILASAVINADTEIADNVVINTNATIENDCYIGAHSHIASRAVLCGKANVGMQSYIGAGAVVPHSKHVPESTILMPGTVFENSERSEGAGLYGLKAAERA